MSRTDFLELRACCNTLVSSDFDMLCIVKSSLVRALIINRRLEILFEDGKLISQFTIFVGCDIL